MTDQEIQKKTVAMRNGEIKMKKDRDYWSDDERQTLRIEFGIGTPVNEIALRLERSETAVYQQIQQMDLYIRAPENTRKRRSVPKEHVCLCSVCSCDRSLCPLCKGYQTIEEGE